MGHLTSSERFRCFLLTSIAIVLVVLNQLYLLSVASDMGIEIPSMLLVPQHRLGLPARTSKEEEEEEFDSSNATVMGIAVGYKLDV